jgi:Helicase conserved C-terminal domain
MNDELAGSDNGESRPFNEKAYRRQSFPDWEKKWHGLTVVARYYFLHHTRTVVKSSRRAFDAIDRLMGAIPSSVVQELRDGGFVDVGPGSYRGAPELVTIRADVYDFATRAHALRGYGLLDSARASQLTKYVDEVYDTSPLIEVLADVLRVADIEGPSCLDDLLERYVTDHRWPGWVAASLDDPLADRILTVVGRAEYPISLTELPVRLNGHEPGAIRKVLEKLIARLALAEDVRPLTWELVVGVLPAVREKMILALMPTKRPRLLKCDKLKEVAPEGSPIVNDLRAVLIELASQPARLRQDLALFHSEVDRFQAALDPLAPWLMSAMKWSNDERPNRATAWARALQLARIEPEGKQFRLHLTPAGDTWLSSGDPDLYINMYELLRTFVLHPEFYSHHMGLFYPGLDAFDTSGPADTFFVGTHVTALVVKDSQYLSRWHVRPEDRLPLRKQLDLAFLLLKPSVFYRMDSVESHLVFAEHNPLNCGEPAERVMVYLVNRLVPATRPRREEVGRLVINAFALQRLASFGCVRAAIDAEGRICIAREPRYDALFGRPVAHAPATDVAGKVVVQPDFSVVVIGPNPAPTAALAPFCERTTRGGGQGAIVMKITRESVVKAVANGLKPAEIVARLQRHATNEVPTNVLRQVQEWSTWVRQITSSSLIALRCPDSETADRVMAALKRQAERANATLVVIDRKKLTTADLNKLRDQGILVTGESSHADEGSNAR